MKKTLLIVALALLIGITARAAVVYTTETVTFKLGDQNCTLTCVKQEITHPDVVVPTPIITPGCKDYCLHKNVTATVFWIGEPRGGGSSEDNSVSCYDGDWKRNYGGYDDYICRKGYYPCKFIPAENPFYVTIPVFDKDLKNKWVKVTRNGITAYAQIEDCGPYVYNDSNYVYNCQRPKNRRANNAGMDVSPALRDYLKFDGLNNAENKVDWKFVDEACVKDGPWKRIVTTSGYNW